MELRSELDRRLLAAGFEQVRGPVESDPVVYRSATTEATKFGAVQTMVAIYDLPSGIRVADLSERSSEAFAHCRQLTQALSKPNYLLVYTVALTERSPASEEFIEKFRPNHWKAREFPTVIDTRTGELLLNRKKPIWGAAYYGGHVTKAEALFSQSV